MESNTREREKKDGMYTIDYFVIVVFVNNIYFYSNRRRKEQRGKGEIVFTRKKDKG